MFVELVAVLLPFEPPPLLVLPPPVPPLDVALFDDPLSVEAVELPPPPHALKSTQVIVDTTAFTNLIFEPWCIKFIYFIYYLICKKTNKNLKLHSILL